MMATPADLEDFAVGFTLSEEIVARAADIGAVRASPYSQGVELAITIPAAAAAALRAARPAARGADGVRALRRADRVGGAASAARR